MATREDEPAPGCRASQEHLLNSKDPLNAYDDCPLCEKRGVLCEVGNHPSRRPLLPSTTGGNYLFCLFDYIRLPHFIFLFFLDLSTVVPQVIVRDRMLPLRVSAGTSFVDLLNTPLPFKIPIRDLQIINQFPAIFEYGLTEYKSSLDTWLDHQLLSLTSKQAVVILDGMWQNVVKSIANVAVLLDEHGVSSQTKLRFDFTAMFENCFVMKGEAKANLLDMMASSGDLTKKLHKHAFKLFPKGCYSIPGVVTCNESVALYSISFFNNRFCQQLVKQYNVSELRCRVDFAVDIFKILIWILSQTEPTEVSHLVPDVRRKTRNGHHITLLEEGILKEFDEHKLHVIQIAIIGSIYALHLPNIEHGRINGKSITITRVGSRLRDAVRARHLDKSSILAQIRSGIDQLHAHGYAHCDICVDNIFVDSQEDGGTVFLGDLECCRKKDERPPVDISRADPQAKTAEDLDMLQLEKLKDELALI